MTGTWCGAVGNDLSPASDFRCLRDLTNCVHLPAVVYPESGRKRAGVTFMDFEQNLFISFTHIDNQPLTDGDKGWITRFHATLKTLLSMRMGREAKIWRDDKLQSNDGVSDQIIEQLNRSATLVSIVSSLYLQSEWCT